LDFTNIELSFLNYSVSLDAAGAFDFLNFVAGGVDSFLLIGTPDSNVTGNLSLGLTFVSSGETLVSSVYGDLIVVPEPPSIVLIAIGVATICVVRWWALQFRIEQGRRPALNSWTGSLKRSSARQAVFFKREQVH
jgi:hypothetical protein